MDDTLSVDALYERAVGLLKDLIRQGEVMQVAWSGGKDSTTTLNLVLDAARQARAEGGSIAPIIVTHSDTLIENAVVRTYVDNQMTAIERFAREQGLDVRLRVAEPNLISTWQVRVVGGRAVPTFASKSASSRDCTVDLKVTPQRRLMAELQRELQREGHGKPITVLGTRLAESAGRRARMEGRGEGAHVNEKRNAEGFVTDRTLAPIAEWSTDDVWAYLMSCGEGNEFPAYVTDFEDTLAVYKDAEGECVIVAGDNLEGKRGGCGARHGCSLCCVVNKDKSMENMLMHERHAWMRGLNRLQQWLVNTQHDWTLRRQVGRRPDPVTGYVRVEPNCYSAETTEFLLRALLTLDERERQRAHRFRELVAAGREGLDAGVAEIEQLQEDPVRVEQMRSAYVRDMQRPRFEMITPEMLVAIDAVWSLDALHPPHHAFYIWDQVVHQGIETEVPKTVMLDRQPRLPPKWFKVEPDAWPREDTFLDPLHVAQTEGCGLYEDVPSPSEEGGFARRLRLVEADRFDVDPEAAHLLLELELPTLLAEHERTEGSRTRGFLHLLRMGVITMSRRAAARAEQMMARAQMWERYGLEGGVRRKDLVDRCIDDNAHEALKERMEREGQEARSAQEALAQAQARARAAPRERALRRAATLTQSPHRVLKLRDALRREYARDLPRLLAAKTLARNEPRFAPQLKPRIEEMEAAMARWERSATKGKHRAALRGLYHRLTERAYLRAASLSRKPCPDPRQFQWGFGVNFTAGGDEQAGEFARMAAKHRAARRSFAPIRADEHAPVGERAGVECPPESEANREQAATTPRPLPSTEAQMNLF